MRGIKIINPGMHSTIQDNGRTAYREFGLPISGAMDERSFHLANWLVRNDLNEGLIETTFQGLEIEFLSSTIFAVCGGNMSPELNGKKILNWRSYKAQSGMRLVLTRLSNGSRAYISFAGGFRIDPMLGSLSTYTKGNIGGYRGRELNKGDVIPLFPAIPHLFRNRKVPEGLIPDFQSLSEFRVVQGVNFDLFSKEAINDFQASEFKISSKSDRMGLRLNGQLIKAKTDKQIISFGIHPGTIQVPGDGNPIIMGMDCQTVGGYPQIANIISIDIPMVGQLKPGDRIKFRIVSYPEALELLKIYRNSIDSLSGKSKPVCTDCIVKRH